MHLFVNLSSIEEQNPNSKHILPQNNSFCNIKNRIFPKKLDQKNRIYYNKEYTAKINRFFAQNDLPTALKTA